MTTAGVRGTLAARRDVENSEYIAFANRILKRLILRVGIGDIESLADMVKLRSTLDEAIVNAVANLKSGVGMQGDGYSWADIGRVLGMTRQAAQEKYTPREPGQPKRVRNRGRKPAVVTQLHDVNADTSKRESA